MADQHEKGNGEVVRGRDERPPHSEDTLVDPGDDLAGIRADDELLDALGGRDDEPADSLVDDELNALLLAWRREVDSRPIGELVDTDTAVATIAAAASPQARRHRFLIPLASAAAVLAIAFTGVSLVARDAQPGDTLWGLTRVLYSEHARSVEAAVAVRTDLDMAHAALRDGRYGEARDALLKASESLPSVSADDGKDDLRQKHEQLMQELTSTKPSPTGTPAPKATSTTTPPPVTTTNNPATSAPPTTDVETPTTTAVVTTEAPPPSVVVPPPPPLPTSGQATPGQTRGDTPNPGTGSSTEGSQETTEGEGE